MKSHKIIFSVVLTLILAVGLKAQVTIKLRQPPPNKLALGDMWAVDLTNPARETFTVHLTAEVTEAQKGLVARATSNDFQLPPGTLRINKDDIREVKDSRYHRDYERSIQQAEEFPAGNYTLCISLKEARSDRELAKDCVHHKMAPLSPPRLIAPRNEETLVEKFPVFAWRPPASLSPRTRVSYSLKIGEILPGQTQAQAMQRSLFV